MSSNSSKSAKFFCENCGAEVPQNARMCRHCGRFFSSVRCPQCGTTGTPDMFSNGCPTCGYAFGNVDKSFSKKQPEEKKAGAGSRRALKKQIKERHDAIYGKDSGYRGDESLPWWMYLLVGIGLMAILAAFFRMLG